MRLRILYKFSQITMFCYTVKDHLKKSCVVFITTKPALWHYHFTSFQLPWWYYQG